MAVTGSVQNSSISGVQRGDQVFRVVVSLASSVAVLLIVALVVLLVSYSLDTIQQFGFRFLTTTTWDPANTQEFGSATYIYYLWNHRYFDYWPDPGNAVCHWRRTLRIGIRASLAWWASGFRR